MAYFVNELNEQVRLDNGNNIFLKGKCRNPKSEHKDYQLIENEEVITDMLAVKKLKRGVAVCVTGHIPVFEYGHTRDEDGKPTCTKIDTGYETW